MRHYAVMIDDDAASSNNWSGQFGIEIEATTTVSVRNIWVKTQLIGRRAAFRATLPTYHSVCVPQRERAPGAL